MRTAPWALGGQSETLSEAMAHLKYGRVHLNAVNADQTMRRAVSQQETGPEREAGGPEDGWNEVD